MGRRAREGAAHLEERSDRVRKRELHALGADLRVVFEGVILRVSPSGLVGGEMGWRSARESGRAS